MAASTSYIHTRATHIVLMVLCIALVSGFVLGIFSLAISNEAAYRIAPTICILALFGIFTLMLRARLDGDIFGEIGFIYISWCVIYTVIPGIGVALDRLEDYGSLTLLVSLKPTATELVTHLWRHVAFMASVSIGYLLLRGRVSIPADLRVQRHCANDLLIASLILLICLCILAQTFLSQPVTNYYEHYVRYDHLPWAVRKFVSICVRLNIGFYCILLVLLFQNYKRYRWLIPPVLLAICSYEISYSFGSRILSFIVLLQAACLYHILVRRISLTYAFSICLALGLFFTAIEFIREAEFDAAEFWSRLSNRGFMIASEFNAVFITGFHLYSDRSLGALPEREWQMFFSDLISLITFGDFKQWNPMEWYARNYYPDSLVAPMTLSPIADSAIWGGNIDLVLRGLLNGGSLAIIVRLFISWRDRTWSIVLYSFCFATAIVTLKYSVFYVLTPLLKTMLPALIIFAVVRRLSTVYSSASRAVST